MAKYTLAVKIDPKVAERVRRYCAERGLKQGFFVQKALEEQIERDELSEDLLDFKKGSGSEGQSISFEDYLRIRRA